MVGLLGAALLGIVPVSLSAPAQAVEAVEADIVATISTTRARFDDTVTIRGTTTCGDTAPDGTVELHRRFAGTERWQLLRTDGAENFAFRFRAKGNADYSVVREADGTCDRSHAGAHLDVLRQMPIAINDRLVFSGTVTPAWTRKPVVVQVRRDGRWVAWETVRTNLGSHWSKRLYARRGTRTYFRAVVRRTTRFQESPSRSVYTHFTSGRLAVQRR